MCARQPDVDYQARIQAEQQFQIDHLIPCHGCDDAALNEVFYGIQVNVVRVGDSDQGGEVVTEAEIGYVGTVQQHNTTGGEIYFTDFSAD